ncbi:transporter [Sphingomonas oligophenolica]|uniref:Transporter n=1 Tax=Sphingomonas oligophenolica TaxID=301154 RepID=A0A502CJW4_9SPHN|nr:transporter [Sphingomonas oligophenolica]TPG11991.1 transporter [Sphingomonas oligophenolica]
MKPIAVALATVLAALPAAAMAQDDAYCPERPGINTPPCVTPPGRVSVETAIVDWTRDDSDGARNDSVAIGDTLVRVGLTDRVEARVGWLPFGHSYARDAGSIATADRVGDVSLGVKALLTDPDGGGALAVAVLPFATLPVGRTPIGAGDWGAGVLLPISYSLTDKVALALTPEVDAAVDGDGDGRHLAYSAAAGLSYALTDALTATGEVQALRDDDPAGHATQTVAALSFAYLATPDTQFDIFAAAGLNRNTPDAELYAGIAHRF